MQIKLVVAPLSLAAAFCLISTSLAQQPRESRQGLRLPVYRVAQVTTAPQAAAANQKTEHPLAPMIAKAEKILKMMEKDVQDYSATMVKRERIDGVLHDHQYMLVKVRHERKNARGEVTVPFSVYLNFLAPDDIKGREVIYVAGRNAGKLTAHDGGTGLLAAIKSAVTVNLAPTSERAMRGNKYPITDIGMQNLMHKLIEVATEDMKYDEVEVKVFENTKVNDRICTCMQSVHPQRDHFRFHIARVYIDNETGLPIRYASYGWPTREGENPPLLEEYTYVNVQLNNGFTDRDYDKSNGNYNFN